MVVKKDRPLTPEIFSDFEKCDSTNPNGMSRREELGENGRFRSFHISEIKERGDKLDIQWLKNESLDDLNERPEPQELIEEAVTELEAVWWMN